MTAFLFIMHSVPLLIFSWSSDKLATKTYDPTILRCLFAPPAGRAPLRWSRANGLRGSIFPGPQKPCRSIGPPRRWSENIAGALQSSIIEHFLLRLFDRGYKPFRSGTDPVVEILSAAAGRTTRSTTACIRFWNFKVRLSVEVQRSLNFLSKDEMDLNEEQFIRCAGEHYTCLSSRPPNTLMNSRSTPGERSGPYEKHPFSFSRVSILPSAVRHNTMPRATAVM